MVIVGTRPDIIKLYPVVKELKKKKFNVTVVSTGQHYELANQMFQTLDFYPDYEIGIMTVGQTLEELTRRLLERLEPIIIGEHPDMVIVQGDTTTALVGALSTYYHKIPVAHVEAGLRTNDIYQPFPEEGNRRMISQIATYNFAPTDEAAENLKNNNVPGGMFITGNTGIDTLLMISKNIKVEQKKQVLVTLHRRENLGEPLKRIIKGLDMFLKVHPDWSILFPVHPNPKVKDMVTNKWKDDSQVKLVQPLDYEQMIMAMKESAFILTDSGGIQEEAPSLNTPVLVARETTERPEGITMGVARLVGTDSVKILDACMELAKLGKTYQSMINKKNPYGDGHASERIVNDLMQF